MNLSNRCRAYCVYHLMLTFKLNQIIETFLKQLVPELLLSPDRCVAGKVAGIGTVMGVPSGSRLNQCRLEEDSNGEEISGKYLTRHRDHI